MCVAIVMVCCFCCFYCNLHHGNQSVSQSAVVNLFLAVSAATGATAHVVCCDYLLLLLLLLYATHIYVRANWREKFSSCKMCAKACSSCLCVSAKLHAACAPTSSQARSFSLSLLLLLLLRVTHFCAWNSFMTLGPPP